MTPPPPPRPAGAPAGPPKPPFRQSLSAPREARAEATFNSAIERPDADRAAFVHEACGEDEELQHRVRELLAARRLQDGFAPEEGASTPAIEAALARLKPEESGDRIGPYKLLQMIGEGGFGVVWMAEQEHPVVRRVALKIIKLGMDTKEVIARFESERQALAMMDHPNIAKVFDAGATQFGRPFFVMELVKGIPITQYCDEAGLGTRERLELFCDVCSAINHAHQKGVIHRDIKPSNVMVTLHGDKAVVKVIDFGIAKATQGKLTDKTLFTRFEQFIGTPVYMSPEQATMSGLDVDTRSDIYALGILLYELLTGKPPFDAQTLASAGYEEMRRIIREVEPPKPSLRLSTAAGAERTRIAKARHIEPAKVRQLVESDLDWIVMKAIDKDRTRRYETANALLQDIRRYLCHEPIVARPPTVRYRLTKTFRRNRVSFSAAAAVVLALLIGITVSTWQFYEKSRAFEQVVESEREQARLRKAAEAAEHAVAEQRDLAQERLLASLVREAQSIRQARKVGFRTQVNDRIRQALAIPSWQTQLDALRAEASQSLGDPTGFEPVTLDRLPAPFVCSALTATGDEIAISAANDSVLVRETARQVKYTSISAAGEVFSLAFSLNGRRLYGLLKPRSSNSTPAARVVIWQRALDDSWSQTSDREIPGALRLFDSREGVVVAVSLEENLQFIGLETDQELANIPIGAGGMKSPVIGVSPDLRFAAIRTANAPDEPASGIEIWDLPAKARRAHLKSQLGPAILASFGADGRYVACSFEYGVQVYDTVQFEPGIACRGYISASDTGASLGGGGTVLAVPFFQENCVRLVNVASGAELARLPTGGPSQEARFSMNGSTLAAFGRFPPCLLRMEDNPEKLTLRGHVGGVPGVEFSPDESLVVSTGKDRKIRFWDARTGKALGVSEDLPSFGQSLAFSPDGKFLASGDYTTEQVQIWSTESRKLMLTLGSDARSGGVWSCIFSPDGRYLFAAGSRQLRAWELVAKPSGAEGLPWEFRTAFVDQERSRNLIFDPVIPELVYEGESSQDGKEARGILSRPLDADAKATFLVRSANAVQSVGLMPKSGELAYFTSRDRSLSFFDRHTRQVTRTMPTLRPGEISTSAIANFKFTPDGRRVAIVNYTGRAVAVFDVASGRALFTLPEESGAVWWLAWNSNGRRLAISQADGDIAIWDIEQVERALKDLGLDPTSDRPSAAAR